MRGPSDRPDISLRPMRWWDIEQALPIERELFPDPWSAATFWSELAGVPDTRHYLVAKSSTGITGFAGLAATRHQADVQTVAVSPEFQRCGIGDLLLVALLDEAVRRDVAEVLLEVRADNDGARRLYERHGFERVAIRRGYYASATDDGVRVDALVMRRRRA